MNYNELFNEILRKRSFLCVGLDSDIRKIPQHLLEADDPVFEFNKAIVDATARYTIAYKPNLAFYECNGVAGWISLNKTIQYIQHMYPEIFIIADAKRGDIGNTSGLYARAFFETMKVDAITVAPYIGHDSVSPFLDYKNKWVILLALTSNKGADDFQYHSDNQQRLFESVLEKSQQWGDCNNMMYVVGATRAEMLSDIRKIVPKHFLLVPGVGAQGGSLHEVAQYGMNATVGLLVNSSRNIIFADSSSNFDKVAGSEAEKMQREMSVLMKEIQGL